MSNAAKIHLTEVPPPYCSSCWGRPDGRFVDFSAVHEGPAFAAREDAEVVGGGPTTSDALILCETCIKTAAAVVGFGDVEQLLDEKTADAEQRELMSDRLASQAAHISQLQQAIASGETLAEKLVAPEPPAGGLDSADMAALREIGKPLGLTFRPGTSKVEARRQIREMQAVA